MIECRAHHETNYEFRRPRATFSRSYGSPKESHIQSTLLDHCNHIKVNVGGKYQDQVLCATAIGTEVVFWKKVRQVPQLWEWSGKLDLMSEMGRMTVEARLFDVRSNGYEFAMEFPGLDFMRGYDGLD